MGERDAEMLVSAPSGRERLLEAAYDLFSRSGVRAIGIDTITAEASVAKMTLYRNFASKSDLAVAFLKLRETRWTVGWLQTEVRSRASTPAGQLLAIFAVFSEWFARDDYEGCAFVATLLESGDDDDPVRQACVRHLANIRAFVRDLAAAAGVEDAERFAAQWHILMKGSIVAAHEGDREAALKACDMGVLLLVSHDVSLPA